MKKETIADKLAKKSFQSAAIQQSWAVHMQAFGPILEPAFVENYKARVHLASALNMISRRDINGGIKKLELVKELCETDADRAAWLFCMGLCFEMAGAKYEMLDFYQNAGQFGHRFYLPYLKVAKQAYSDGAYEAAEENFRLGIQCLEDSEIDDQKRMILSSSYANLASALIMMHRLEEAEEMLQSSEHFGPEVNTRMATKAILYAVRGDHENAEVALRMVEKLGAELWEATKKTVTEIEAGTHPHFYPVKLNTESVEAFWRWFREEQMILKQKTAEEAFDEVFGLFQEPLKRVFPFMEREFEMGIQPEDTKIIVFFCDFYTTALAEGFEQLLGACPEELGKDWEFEIVH